MNHRITDPTGNPATRNPATRSNATRSGRGPALVLLASGLAASLLASCNIVTPVVYAIEGPGKIDAEYTLPDKKTVVFVDDPENILPRTALRTSIGDAVSFDLMGREALTTTVATRDAIAVSRSSPGGDGGALISIEAIGRAVDASQVIHIQPVIFDLVGRTDTQGLRPTAKVTVKVIDLDLKLRTYPAASALPGGREVVATIREADPNILRSRGGRAELEEQLASKLSVQIAQLFYEHDRIDLGENLGTRKQ